MIVLAIAEKYKSHDKSGFADKMLSLIRFELEQVGKKADLLGARMKLIYSSFDTFITDNYIDFDKDMPNVKKYVILLDVMLFIRKTPWG